MVGYCKAEGRKKFAYGKKKEIHQDVASSRTTRADVSKTAS